MTRQETQAVLAVIKVAFPNFQKDKTRDDLTAVVNLWYLQFEDYDFDLVNAAVQALIAEQVEGYPLTIGAVKKMAMKLSAPESLTEMEAWTLVSRAARNSAYHAEREFEKLPPAVQQTVGCPEQLRAWAMMDTSEFESVVASNFMRTYRTVQERELESMLLPASVRNSLPALRTGQMLPGESSP